jgi:hypothetical protein
MLFGKILIGGLVLGHVPRLSLPQTFFVVLGAVSGMHVRASALRGGLTFAKSRTAIMVAVIGR